MFQGYVTRIYVCAVVQKRHILDKRSKKKNKKNGKIKLVKTLDMNFDKEKSYMRVSKELLFYVVDFFCEMRII